MNSIDKLKIRAVNSTIQNSNLSDEEKLDLYQKACDRMAQQVQSDKTIDPRRKDEISQRIEKGLREINEQRITTTANKCD